MNVCLRNQTILKCKHKRNDGHVWYPCVHRGDFIKKSFIGDTRHPSKRCDEDAVFRKLLKQKFGYQEEKIDVIVYHYNEPRIGSLTWEHRKELGIRGYSGGVEEWEQEYKK